MANKKWEVIRKEAMKCELLCSNCHRIEHSSRYNESFVNEVNNYRGRLLE
jgi:predicted HNH restriction endonuclease